MGETKIEWTATYNADGSVTPGKTWNPVRGCSRVSEGCRNCYAERQAARFAGSVKSLSSDPANWGKHPGPFSGFVHIVNGHPAWTGKVELIERHLADPLKWKQPCKIFVNSMSDLFHEALSDEAIDRVFAVMALCPQHTFQCLSKRPERMRRYLSEPGRSAALPNVWLGVSVEDQTHADQRIPLLLQTPAAVRFVSYEPALGPVDFYKWLLHLDQIIIGGESGPGARPFDLSWARSLIEQCQIAGIAAFVKQLGAKPVAPEPNGRTADGRNCVYACQGIKGADGLNRYTLLLDDRKGGDCDEWPSDLRVRQFPEAFR